MSKDDYRFYSERGICVACRRRDAMYGSRRCDECAEKESERSRKRNEELKNSPDYTAYLADLAKRRRETRQRRRDAGICATCGKRPAARGHRACLECSLKRRRIRDRRYNNEIPRSMRPGLGLCYVCGATVLQGKTTCATCHERLRQNGLRVQANPTEKMIAARERYKEMHNRMMGHWVFHNTKEAKRDGSSKGV